MAGLLLVIAEIGLLAALLVAVLIIVGTIGDTLHAVSLLIS